MNQVKSTDLLLVDDNIDDAALILRVLQKNISITHLHLEDGEEALHYLFNQKKYDTLKLIILDLKMPKVSGIEVLKIIKSDARTKNIPVVILTSSKEESDIRECYRLGSNSYIVKPVEFEEFSFTVSNVLNYWMHLNQGPF